MLGFPASTEFGKRIPKQKFYENLDVSPALRRVFVDQIRLVYWRNKLAASTLNIAAGEAVTEIEVFEVRLNDPQLDEAVLKQIDKEIPYHILFILTCDGKAQAWIGYKEAAASGSNAFKVGRYYHTDWMPEDELHLSIDGLNMDAVYESLVRQIAGDKLQTDSGESLKESTFPKLTRQRPFSLTTLEQRDFARKPPRSVLATTSMTTPASLASSTSIRKALWSSLSTDATTP